MRGSRRAEIGGHGGLRADRPRSVGVTFVTLGLVYGVWYAYSVFLVALLREFGWSRSLVAGAFSIFTLVHGLLGLPLGWLADRAGPRRLVLAGGAILAAGLVLDGAVERPWHLYLTFGVLTGVGVATAGWVPAVVLVQRWFPDRVGTALGLTSAGIGVGILVVVPGCQWLIDALGWRWAFRIVGAVIALWVIPATFLLVRDPPPAAEPAPRPTIGPARPLEGTTLGGALRLLPFWLIATAQTCTSFTNQMLLVHQVAYLVDHAIPALIAASVVGVIGVSSVVGKSGGGWFSDRFGREVTYTLGAVSVLASLGALAMVARAPAAHWAYGYGILVGLGYAVTAPLMPALVNDYFRGRHFGAIFGALHITNAVGSSLGPWVAGRVFDGTGSYWPAFGAAAASGMVATAALWLARARRRRAGSIP